MQSTRILKLFVLLTCLLSPSFMQADNKEDLLRLEAEMLKYFNTNESETFFKVTKLLKDLSQEAGEERLFYKAWGNEAI